MTVIFMGGETPSFLPSGADFSERNDIHNTAFARASLAGTGSAYGESLQLGGLNELWLHYDLGLPGFITADPHIILLNGSTQVFRVNADSGLQMQALISSVWTNVGSAVPWSGYTGSVGETIDIHIVGNSGSGTATLYTSGTERTTATVDLTAVASLDTVRIISGACVSQVIVADEPTIGWRLATYYPSGNGANTTWIGDYTSVDELDYTDADFIYSASANEIETYTCTGPALTGYVVRAVGVYCRARRGTTGPQSLQLAVRVNGTNYFSGSKALGLGYANYGNIWEDNPDTTVDWLASAISAVQPGVKSIA